MGFCPGVCSVSPDYLDVQNLSGFEGPMPCVISEVASPELPSVSRLILLGLQLQMERSNTPQALVLSPQQIPVVRVTTQHKEQVLLTQKQDLMEVITSRENSPKQPSRFSWLTWFYQFHFTPPMKSILYPSILISVSRISTTPSRARFPDDLEDGRRSRVFSGSKCSGNILSAWET